MHLRCPLATTPLIATVALSLAASSVIADSITWIGGVSNDWFNGQNWSPGGEFGVVPNTDDTATINNGKSVNITRSFNASDAVASLTLSNGSDLRVNGYTLDVNGTLSIRDTNTDLFISDGGQIDANLVLLTSAAEFRPSGVVDVNAALSMGNGYIILGADDTLTFSQGATISGGNISVGTDSTVAFEGSTQLSGTSSFTISSGGQLDLNGATTFPVPTVGTNTVNLNGSGVLHQNGDVTVHGPTVINGNGTWDMDGDMGGGTVWHVNDDLTLNVARLEADTNHAFNGQFDLSGSGTTMAINTNTDWTMVGSLILRNGTTLAGTAKMNVTGYLSSVGSGKISAPVEFRTGSEVAIGLGYEGYKLELDGPTTYRGGIFRGGTIQQDGDVYVTASTTIGTNDYKVVIPGGNPPFQRNWLQLFDWDGSSESAAETTISPGVTFTINAVSIESNYTADGYDGTLNINGGTLVANLGARIETPRPNAPVGAVYPAAFALIPWRLDGTMNLQGADNVVTSNFGSVLNLYGEINALSGDSVFSATNVILTPSGNIHVADGATLAINTGGGGSVDVDTGGYLRLFGGGTLNPSVQVTVDGTMELDGSHTLQGGTYNGTGTLRMLSSTSIAETTRLDVYSEFASGGTTTIASNSRQLRFANGAIVYPGASFSGSGAVRNLTGSNLHLVNGADLGVHVVNEGTLTLGASPGIVMVDEFTQGPTGKLEIEVEGYSPGIGHDQLQVAGIATLAGRLEVPILSSFTVDLQEPIRFLTYGSRVGQFSTVTSPNLTTLLDDNIAFDVKYRSDGADLVFDEIDDNIVLEDTSNMVFWNSSTAWRDVDNIVSPAFPTLLHDMTLQNIVSSQPPEPQMVIVQDTNAFMAKLTVGGGGPDDLILKIGDVAGAGTTGHLSSTKGVSLQEQGVIDLYDNALEGVLVTPELTIEGGLLKGSGKIDLSGASTGGRGVLTLASGTISPGHSVGTLVIGGDLAVSDEGAVVIEMTSEESRDMITVEGDALVEGTLKIDATGNTLLPGDKVEFLRAETIDGDIAALEIVGDDDLNLAIRQEETADDMIAFIGAVCSGPGDMNCFNDGITTADIAPFALALKNKKKYLDAWGQIANRAGDLDGNGRLDFDDIPAFAAELNMPLATLLSQLSFVPEPGTLWIALGCCLSMLVCTPRHIQTSDSR